MRERGIDMLMLVSPACMYIGGLGTFFCRRSTGVGWRVRHQARVPPTDDEGNFAMHVKHHAEL